MKASELRDKTVADLRGELESLRREQFNLRMEHGAGQLAQPHRMQTVRRDIARIKTVLAEKQAQGSEA